MTPGFREEYFDAPSDPILPVATAETGGITTAEARAFSTNDRRLMAEVAEVLVGARPTTSNIEEDWRDPADPGTWKKPLVEGEK